MEEIAEVEPKKVVQRFVDEVLNRKNPAAADELISSESLKQRVSAFLTSFPDLEVSIQHLVAEGDMAASHLFAQATHRAPFQGMPATGKQWAATCSALYEIEDGRISGSWVNWDLLAIMEQIGAVRRTEAASA